MKNLKRLLLIYSTLLLLLIPLLALPGSPSATMGQMSGPVFVAQAQGKPDSCPDMVRKAVQKTSSECANTGRNKACYGNTAISAIPQNGVNDVQFAKPGDITDLKNLRVVKLSQLDQTAQTWGIALLRVQADLPDTAPGQNVTVLMFGDVELSDNVPAASDARSTSVASTQTAVAPTLNAADTMVVPTKIHDATLQASQVNNYYTQVFQTPNAYATGVESRLETRSTAQQATLFAQSTNQNATAQSRLASANPTQQSQATTVNGTLVARSDAQNGTLMAINTAQYATVWAQNTAQSLRQQANVTQVFGTAYVQATKDVGTLIAPQPVVAYNTMQAFYFRSGIGEAACAEAPRDGIMIQTPQGSQRVNLTINGAEISVGSTIFIKSPRGGAKMTVTTLEGGVSVAAFGASKPAMPGTSVTLPLDANGVVNGPPDDPVPADARDLQSLPVRGLPRFIQIPKPASAPLPVSIKSRGIGDACVQGPLTAGGTAQEGASVVGVYVGGVWSAKAGTTATFKASGNLLLQSAWKDYILLTTNGDPSAQADIADAEYDDALGSYGGAFARSGGSSTLTYTFTKDIPAFYIGVGASAPGGVSVAVTCDNAAPTAAGSITPTQTQTRTNTPSATP